MDDNNQIFLFHLSHLLKTHNHCDDLPPEVFTSLRRSPIVPQSVCCKPGSCPDVNTIQIRTRLKLLQSQEIIIRNRTRFFGRTAKSMLSCSQIVEEHSGQIPLFTRWVPYKAVSVLSCVDVAKRTWQYLLKQRKN